MSEQGEFQKRWFEFLQNASLHEGRFLHIKGFEDFLREVTAEAKHEFYEVWNSAYGSSSQQGIDIYNKWFLKWFGFGIEVEVKKNV